MKKVTLFTKLDCHLCLDAYRLLLEVAYDRPLEIDVVDITHDHNVDFRALYAERIPVVKIPETEAELGWPFTLEELKAFLGAESSNFSSKTKRLKTPSNRLRQVELVCPGNLSQPSKFLPNFFTDSPYFLGKFYM